MTTFNYLMVHINKWNFYVYTAKTMSFESTALFALKMSNFYSGCVWSLEHSRTQF